MFAKLRSFFTTPTPYLLFILLLGLFLVTFRLGSVPSGFHWDEAANGFSAFSIMESGKDEWGVSYPLFIQSFGDFKSAFLSYAIIPFFKIGGVTEAMARLPGALLALFGVYSFIHFIFPKSKGLGLLAGLVLVTNPWFLHYSRIAFEPMPSLGLMLGGVWLWHTKQQKIKVAGGLLLLLSMYVYHSARLFVPVLVVLHLIAFHRQEIKKHLVKQKWSWLLVVIGSAVTWYSVLFTSGGERAKDVFFWNQTELTTVVEEGIYRNRVLGFPMVRVFNNKGWEVLTVLSKKYANHFSPEYLMPQNNQTDAFSFQRQGNFYLFLVPFLLIGIFSAYKRDSYYWFFLGWLLTSPIPSSLTSGMINPNRSLIMIPALCYFAARGIVVSKAWVEKNTTLPKKEVIFTGFISLLFITNFGLYFHDWLVFFPEASEPYWHGFNKQASQDVWQKRHEYDTVYFTNLTTLEGIKEFENVKFWPVKSNTAPCYLKEENSLVVISANDSDALPTEGFEPHYTYYHLSRFHSEKPALFVYESKQMTPEQRLILNGLCVQKD
jgi:hypothetical protein